MPSRSRSRPAEGRSFDLDACLPREGDSVLDNAGRATVRRTAWVFGGSRVTTLALSHASREGCGWSESGSGPLDRGSVAIAADGNAYRL